MAVMVFLFLVFILLTTTDLPISTDSAHAQSRPKFNSGKYIIVLADRSNIAEEVAKDMVKTHDISVDHVYSRAIRGFSASIPVDKIAAVRKDTRVRYISEDREVKIFNTRPVRIPKRKIPSLSQTIPSGIQRINARQSEYKGTDIGVAVIDTGIDLTHPDISSNIIADKSCIRGRRNGNDDNGHGTHVAGIIAALDNSIGVVGVAPQSRLIAVKSLDSRGAGTWSSLICGIDWVTENAEKYNIKVVNMSLGGAGVSDGNCGDSNNDALHRAICNSVNAGITYVVAAGNNAFEVDSFVPASYDDAVITVSALVDSDGLPGGFGASTFAGDDDTFAVFNNYGSAIDLGAPGVSIYSTWKKGGYNTISGTSMATPHVSGAAVLFIEKTPNSSWRQVKSGLINNAEKLNLGHTDHSGLHPEPVVWIP